MSMLADESLIQALHDAISYAQLLERDNDALARENFSLRKQLGRGDEFPLAQINPDDAARMLRKKGLTKMSVLCTWGAESLKKHAGISDLGVAEIRSTLGRMWLGLRGDKHGPPAFRQSQQ